MSDTPQRRATDKEGAAPAPAQGPTLTDVYVLLTEIKTTQEGMISAFVLDDLGKPDFSGHRAAHKKQIADADATNDDDGQCPSPMSRRPHVAHT